VARYRYVYARGRDDGREEATSPGMGSFGFESAGVLTRPWVLQGAVGPCFATP
jgi:hypothetical protein